MMVVNKFIYMYIYSFKPLHNHYYRITYIKIYVTDIKNAY